MKTKNDLIVEMVDKQMEVYCAMSPYEYNKLKGKADQEINRQELPVKTQKRKYTKKEKRKWMSFKIKYIINPILISVFSFGIFHNLMMGRGSFYTFLYVIFIIFLIDALRKEPRLTKLFWGGNQWQTMTIQKIHKSLYHNLEFLLFNIETKEGVDELNEILQIYNEMGYPMEDFIADYIDTIEDKREMYKGGFEWWKDLVN